MHSPKTANTTAKLARIKRDNITVGDHWCLVGEDVVIISRQKAGGGLEASLTLSKRDFNRIVRFYTTPTKAADHV